MDFSTTAVQQCDTLFILFRFCYVFVFISFIVVVVALFIVFACVVFFSSPFFSLSLSHTRFSYCSLRSNIYASEESTC